MIPLILCQINWWQFQRKIHYLVVRLHFIAPAIQQLWLQVFTALLLKVCYQKFSDGQKVYYFATGSFISVEKNPRLCIFDTPTQPTNTELAKI